MEETFTLHAQHSIIKNHSVDGKNLLPGLAYIDLLYQVFRENGYPYDQLELRNLSIYNPLIVQDGEIIAVTVTCTEVQDRYWKIVVNGQLETEGQKQHQNLKYVTADMYPCGAISFDEKLDGMPGKKENTKSKNVSEIYDKYSELSLKHSGVMKAGGSIEEFPDYLLMDLNVDPPCAHRAKKMMFHPGLIDCSGICSAVLFERNVKDEKSLFLPIYFESFRACGLIQDTCITRIKTGSLEQSAELMYLTMEFFNQSGNKIAELARFAGKKVRTSSGNDETDGTHAPQLPHSLIISGTNGAAHSSDPATCSHFSSGTVDELERSICRIIASWLGVPVHKIDGHKGYYELGMHSAMLLELVNKLEELLERELSPTLLFEYTTISELAAHLVDNGIHSVQKGDQSARPAAFLLNAESPETENNTKEPGHQSQDIAVISLAGRYPRAANIREFWENLCEGRDCITEIPADRWNLETYYHKDKEKAGFSSCKWGGFLDDISAFDSLFFNISPKEAEIMDPKERLYLGIIWELLESAGYTREKLTRQTGAKVGCFVGAMFHQYHYLKSDLPGEAAVSLSSNGSIANRISYWFNLKGPSLAIDTACSSSTVAIHQACESLIRGECNAAIAGGVNLSIHPKKYIALSQAGLISDNPDIRSFGEGNGYLPAEAVGAVLLKPLSVAEKDNDTILAVIKSTTVNHNGHSNGFTVPDVQAQAEMIEENLKKARIDPRTISYVESAANGSALGDPIEITGLTKVFRKYSGDTAYCAIGTVKSNIGHAEAASGISQLTKVILQLQHKKLVPTIKAEPVNSKLDFSTTPFYLVDRLTAWEKPVLNIEGSPNPVPRRATVSSFGAGGTNGHIILEEYEPAHKQEQPDDSGEQKRLIIFSAQTARRLEALIKDMYEYLDKQKDLSLSDIAYTLQTGREAMDHRLAVIVSNHTDLMLVLKNELQKYTGKSLQPLTFPVYRGNLENEMPLESGNSENQNENGVLKKLAAEGDLAQLANLWVHGAVIPWQSLYHKAQVTTITGLPTYPFEPTRYWLGTPEEKEESTEKDFDRNTGAQPECPEEPKEFQKDISVFIIEYLAKKLNLPVERIKPNRNLREYGVDSIIIMSLIRRIDEHFDINTPAREVIEHNSLGALVEYFNLKIEENGSGADYPDESLLPDKTNKITFAKSGTDVPDEYDLFKKGELSMEQMLERIENRKGN